MVRQGVLIFALAINLCGGSVYAVEAGVKDAAVAVEYYFSNKDHDLAACDKVLADIVKQMPNILIERVCIDDKKGYARLVEEEKRLGISKPGDRTLIFGPYFLLSKGDQKDIETFFCPMMRRIFEQMTGEYAYKKRLLPDVNAYAKSIYGKSAIAKMEPDQKGNAIVYYRVMKEGKFEGWVADAYDPIGCPICSSAQLLVATDPKAAILNVRPARPIERLSTKIPEDEIESYCNQFKGRSPAKLPGKVDGVSRATKSTHAYMESITDILTELGKKLNPNAEPLRK